MNDRQQAVRQVQRDLLAMRDDGYQAFHSKLVPNLSPELVIGVRTPQLRAYAKKLAGTETAELFLEQLPHTYYEENNLHGMLLATAVRRIPCATGSVCSCGCIWMHLLFSRNI